MRRKNIAIVGAGLAGATVAFELAQRGGYKIAIFDKRNHVAGNAHTERDPETGVMVHKYGPHIFHTDNEVDWKWFSTFTTLVPYIQRTKGLHNGSVYSLPINLHTINQFYKRTMNPREAREFIDHIVACQSPGARNRMPTLSADPSTQYSTFADYGRDLVGPELYEAFLMNYTQKQWGLSPTQLPPSILKRLPIRFNYEDNAFSHKWQGIPFDGYTAAVKKMLADPAITVHLRTKINANILSDPGFDHVFYSGPLDEWFNYQHGCLPYRTLDFVSFVATGDYQGCAVMNNCDIEPKYTRSTEHKHFTPWERHELTTVTREYSRAALPGDDLFYPVSFAGAPTDQVQAYRSAAAATAGVTFIGRLGTFQYLDMDRTINASRKIAYDFDRWNRT